MMWRAEWNLGFTIVAIQPCVTLAVGIVQGYRTGYVYREPPVPQAEEGKPAPHNEVVVPPTVSSYTYSFEEDTGKETTYVTISPC